MSPFEFIKTYLPNIYNFFKNFFDAMNNKKEGHSLRKWLAVGFFWLIAVIVYRYTDQNNAVEMVLVLSGMITSLIITYTVGNNRLARIEKDKDNKDTNTDENSN